MYLGMKLLGHRVGISLGSAYIAIFNKVPVYSLTGNVLFHIFANTCNLSTTLKTHSIPIRGN